MVSILLDMSSDVQKGGNMRPIYEIRVDLADGYEIVKLEAASIEEALHRASRIWPNPQEVTLLARVEQTPAACLAF